MKVLISLALILHNKCIMYSPTNQWLVLRFCKRRSVKGNRLEFLDAREQGFDSGGGHLFLKPFNIFYFHAFSLF